MNEIKEFIKSIAYTIIFLVAILLVVLIGYLIASILVQYLTIKGVIGLFLFLGLVILVHVCRKLKW